MQDDQQCVVEVVCFAVSGVVCFCVMQGPQCVSEILCSAVWCCVLSCCVRSAMCYGGCWFRCAALCFVMLCKVRNVLWKLLVPLCGAVSFHVVQGPQGVVEVVGAAVSGTVFCCSTHCPQYVVQMIL